MGTQNTQDNSTYTLSSLLLLKVMNKVQNSLWQDSQTKKKKRQMTHTIIAGLAWYIVVVYIIRESQLLSRGMRSTCEKRLGRFFRGQHCNNM